MLSLLLLCVLVSCAKPNRAFTPQQSNSWYLTADPADKAFKEMKTLAHKDATQETSTGCRTTAPQVVALFVGHFVNGQELTIQDYKKHSWTLPQLARASQHYLATWLNDAQLCDNLIFTLSVSNIACPDEKQADTCKVDYASAGQQWSELVKKLHTWIQKTSTRIVVWGSLEITTEGTEPDQTQAFIDAYRPGVASDNPLVTIGALKSNDKWKEQDLLNVTTGPQIVVLPRLTGPLELAQWQEMAKAHSEMRFIGAMTECAEDSAQIQVAIEQKEHCHTLDKQFLNPKEAWEGMKSVVPDNMTLYAQTNLRMYDPEAEAKTPVATVEATSTETLTPEVSVTETGEVFDKGQQVTVTPIVDEDLYATATPESNS